MSPAIKRRPDEESGQGADATPAQRGLYFGPHFVIGDNRFAAAGPETFLFGGLASDLAGLSGFGMNRLVWIYKFFYYLHLFFF